MFLFHGGKEVKRGKGFLKISTLERVFESDDGGVKN